MQRKDINVKKVTFIKVLYKVFVCLAFINMTLCLTSCGKQEDFVTSPVMPAHNADSFFSDDIYEHDYLSKDICVIPAKRQSKSDGLVTAKAAFLINDTTNTMIFSKNVYKKMYPASITKIVTALVALKYGNLDDMVTISYNASHITEYGAKLCGFMQGDKIKMDRLLYSFLICSGNDAGIAIAEHISGSVDAFSNLMNNEMKDLGAVHSHFTNPHGLHDDNHYTTPYDLYLVFHELMQNKIFSDIINKAYYKAKFHGADGKKKAITFYSTDRYLLGRATAPEGVTVIGGKTGTTSDAGSNLILYTKNNDGNDYISLVMKADYADSLYLQMNYLLSME